MSRIHSNVLDELLYYLSHVGELRWEKFKSAIDCLRKDQPIFKYDSSYLNALARVGHLDYDPDNLDRVFIAPAVLVGTAVADRYILVGSRTPDFLLAIEKVVQYTGGKFNRILEIYAPTTILLRELTEASFLAIEGLGIQISRGFSAKLSGVLPSPIFDDFHTIESLQDARIDRFNVDTLEYKESPQIGGEGLYRFPRYGRYVHILKLGPNLREVPREWGEWLVLRAFRKTGLIHYDKETRTLWVKERLTMPPLADRCVTLCSGRPPEKKDGFFCYPDVLIGIAFRLAESLYQRLEVVP